MFEISLLLPTRNRPKQLQRFLKSVAEKTSNLSKIEVILYIDDDDILTPTVTLPKDFAIHSIYGPRLTMGHANSACLKQSNGKIIFLVNDDIIIQTKNWDQIVIEQANQFQDEIFLLYPNDCFKQHKLPVFPILSKTTCEILNTPFPEEYKGAFIDTHLLDIFQRLQKKGHNRIKYLSNVVFEHMHYRLDKSEFDDTYKERDRFGDEYIFLQLIEKRSKDAENLNNHIENKPLDTIEHSLSTSTKYRPSTTMSTISYYFKSILFDKGHRIKTRIYLFYYFCGRYIAQKYILK